MIGYGISKCLGSISLVASLLGLLVVIVVGGGGAAVGDHTWVVREVPSPAQWPAARTEVVIVIGSHKQWVGHRTPPPPAPGPETLHRDTEWSSLWNMTLTR